jgi:hypothetical protein
MLTDTQIDEIDYLAAQEKYWNFDAYIGCGVTPDTVRSLAKELKRQRRMLAAVRAAWLEDGDDPMEHREAAAWVRTNWPSLAAALERLAQNSEW